MNSLCVSSRASLAFGNEGLLQPHRLSSFSNFSSSTSPPSISDTFLVAFIPVNFTHTLQCLALYPLQRDPLLHSSHRFILSYPESAESNSHTWNKVDMYWLYDLTNSVNFLRGKLLKILGLQSNYDICSSKNRLLDIISVLFMIVLPIYTKVLHCFFFCFSFFKKKSEIDHMNFLINTEKIHFAISWNI